MASIPTIPGTQQVTTPSIGVRQNFAALNVANEAKMQMGDAIGQLGEQVSAFSQKLQAAKNYGIAADASRQMQAKWGEFVDSRKGRDDEDNWVKEWQDTATNLKSSVYDQHNPGPALKRQLDQNFQDWALTNTIETKTIANKKAIGTANLRVDEAINEAAKTGHPEAAEPQIRDLIKGKVSAGLIAPIQAKSELQAALNKVDEYGARNYIDSNPVGAAKYLEDKNNLSRLDPDQRDRFLTEARVRRHQYQSDQVQGIRDSYDSGTPKSKAELDNLEKTEQISPRGREMYNAYVKGDTLKKSKENYDAINGDIMLSHPENMQPDERAAWKAHISEDAIGLQDVHKNMIASRLASIDKSIESKEQKVSDKLKSETVSEMRRQYNLGFVLPGQSIQEYTNELDPNTGLFGWKWTQSKKKVDKIIPAAEDQRRSWMFRSSEDVKNATKARFISELGKMDDFFKQHEKDNNGTGPSRDDAEEFRQKLMEPYLAENVSKALTSQIPATSKYEVGKKYKDAKGNVATWNGNSFE